MTLHRWDMVSCRAALDTALADNTQSLLDNSPQTAASTKRDMRILIALAALHGIFIALFIALHTDLPADSPSFLVSNALATRTEPVNLLHGG